MKKYLIGFFLLIIFSGCGLKEGVLETEAKSYLWFTGNTKNAAIYIDSLDPFTLSSLSSNDTHYQLSPGKHRVVVRKNGDIVIERNLLLGKGITKEISIP